MIFFISGVILIKKAGDGSKKIKGCWDSIHVVEVQEKSRSARYKLTSTAMLWLQTNKAGSGTMNLGGSLTRQVTIDFKHLLWPLQISFNCFETVEFIAYVTPSGYCHETVGLEPCLRTLVSYLPVRSKKNWREPKLGTDIIIIISRLSQDLLESSEQPLTSKGQPGPARYWISVAAHPCPSHPHHREALIPRLYILKDNNDLHFGSWSWFSSIPLVTES